MVLDLRRNQRFCLARFLCNGTRNTLLTILRSLKMFRNILRLRKTTAVSLQQKDFNPADTDEWEWIDVHSYLVRESYYYCFYLSDGSHIPEPIVTKIANTFWRFFVPDKFWKSVRRVYVRI